ncbi:MAG: hypothetical protein NC401_15565 [Ruminococcus sp.]|nr:hypothetical protein [Ruminococcus sp.]
MAEAYRICMVCGKRFKACGTCHSSAPEELQWRRVVCCPQHFAFHLPIIRYVRKEIGKENARETLENAFRNYGEVEFTNDIRAVVDEILSD